MRSGLIRRLGAISLMLPGVLSTGVAYPDIARQISGYALGIGAATEGYGGGRIQESWMREGYGA